MIKSLLSRYSKAFAVLAIGASLIAAPYLIPENPDSPVFRTGTLALLLMLGAISPVHAALKKHSLTSLIYGCGSGFIFLLCLGIGNELRFYDQLLPGMGSFASAYIDTILSNTLLQNVSTDGREISTTFPE